MHMLCRSACISLWLREGCIDDAPCRSACISLWLREGCIDDAQACYALVRKAQSQCQTNVNMVMSDEMVVCPSPSSYNLMCLDTQGAKSMSDECEHGDEWWDGGVSFSIFLQPHVPWYARRKVNVRRMWTWWWVMRWWCVLLHLLTTLCALVRRA
jgi:hypothetical protein